MEKGVCFGCIDWLKGVREWEWYCDACGSTGCVVDKCGDGGNGKGKGKEKEESDDEGDEVEAGAKGKGKGKGKERDESEDEGSGRLCDGMSAMGL